MKRNCHYRRFLSAFLDEELPNKRREEISSHLAQCPSCREELNRLEETRAFLTRLPSIQLSSGYWAFYEMSLQAKMKKRKPASLSSVPRVALRYLIFALTLLLLSVGVVTGGGTPVPLEVSSSVPGATVYLDGQVLGLTPFKANISPGNHAISLHKEGYRIWDDKFFALSANPVRFEVRLVSLASTGQVQLHGVQEFSSPSISPDGKTLALLGSKSSFLSGSGELWIYDFTHKTLVKEEEGLACVRPAWSPDSRRLAFVRSQASKDLVVIQERETGFTLTASAPTPVTASLVWLSEKQIAYLAGESPRIYLLDLSNLRSTSLVSAPVESFSLSPDGRWICYISAEDGGVYILSMLTTVNRMLIPPGRECFALAWSPSGNQIAVGSRQGLHLLDVNGEGEKEVLAEPTQEVVWAADGRLLFRTEDQEESIWLWDPVQEVPTLLVRDPSRKGSLTISPGSDFILYSSDQSGFQRIWSQNLWPPAEAVPFLTGSMLSLSSQPQGAEIYLAQTYLGRTPTILSHMDAGVYDLKLKKEGYQEWGLQFYLKDGETKEIQATLLSQNFPYQALTHSLGEKREAVASPDGKWLAYVEQGMEEPMLTIVDLAAARVIPLGTGRQPAWTPASDELYFTRGTSYSDIWSYRPVSGEFKQLTKTGAAQSAKPSPSGGWIAYLQGLDPHQLELWLMNADGGDARPLLKDQGNVFDLAWSPDEKGLTCLIHREGADWVVFVDLQGKQEELFQGSDLSLATWSPNGRLLAFMAASERGSELRIYTYPELTFYFSQAVEKGKASLFWRSDEELTWANSGENGLSYWRLKEEQGVPELFLQLKDCSFLSFSSPDRILISSSWNGTSQIYSVPLPDSLP